MPLQDLLFLQLVVFPNTNQGEINSPDGSGNPVFARNKVIKS